MISPNHAIRSPLRRDVTRYLLALLAVWAIILGPGLCVGGVLEHLCLDCAPAAACDHEEDCAADPCLEPVVQPIASAASVLLLPVVALIVRLYAPPTEPPSACSGFADRILPERKNLSRPESDLPLLI